MLSKPLFEQEGNDIIRKESFKMGISKYEGIDLCNGIIKIEGYNRIGYHNKIDDRKEVAVRIDSKVTPIFCSACNKQVPGFYKHLGSRYGQVGAITCERCQSTIYVTDNDNIVDTLHNSVGTYRNPFLMDVEKLDNVMQTYTFDYSSLYFLNGWIFEQIEAATGFQLLQEFDGWVDLADVIVRICEKINQSISPFTKTPYYTDPRIAELPDVIHTWLGLLVYLGIIKEKEEFKNWVM